MYTAAAIVCIALGIFGSKDESAGLLVLFGIVILFIAGPFQGVF